jgi:AP-2 complex subunit mu-1
MVKINFLLKFAQNDVLECLDFGYPQILTVDLLTKYIKSANSQEDKIKNFRQADDKITSEITGAIDWREPDKYKYRKNEVYIDIVESINMLKSVKGETLKNDVSGKVMMKTFLSGMPECKFGMNDKLVLEKDNRANKKYD